MPPRIVPAKGTGTKVPRALPIVAPTPFAAALPIGSPDHSANKKSTRPPIIGILPNTLPANLFPAFPKSFVVNLEPAFPKPLPKTFPGPTPPFNPP